MGKQNQNSQPISDSTKPKQIFALPCACKYDHVHMVIVVMSKSDEHSSNDIKHGSACNFSWNIFQLNTIVYELVVILI